jgi:hypothetical protein
MIAHATEEHITSAIIGKLQVEVLACSPAKGEQCCWNGTCNMPPTSTAEVFSVGSNPRLYHSTKTVEFS